MVLLNLNSEGNEAATIEKPNILYSVFDAISKKYNEKTAKRYSELVANFLKDNMAFPDDGIYKLEGSQFFVFDLKTKKWKKTDKGKADYVIAPTSDFWVKYDQTFPFLKVFKKEIETIIHTQTKEMFDQKQSEIRYIEVRDKEIVCHQAEEVVLSGVFRDYLAEDATNDYVNDLLKFVFDTPEYPVFVIYKGMIHACITSKKVKSQKKLDDLMTYLQESFLPEDAKQIYIRVRNVLTFGKDKAHYLITEIDAEGRPIYELCGFKVVDLGIYKVNEKYSLPFAGILLTQENADRIFKELVNESEKRHSEGREYKGSFWYFNDGITEFSLYCDHCKSDKTTYISRFGWDYVFAKHENATYKQIPIKLRDEKGCVGLIPDETIESIKKFAPTSIIIELLNHS